MLLSLLLGLAAGALPSPSIAGQNLSIHGLSASPSAWRQGRFELVARELAMIVAPTPAWSVASLSTFDFEVGLTTRIGFVNAQAKGGDEQSAWDEAVDGEKASKVLPIPRLWFRKGLPFSFEVGGNVGWHAGAEAFVVGGYGRWVLLDRWPKVPDLAIQVGYDGYIGNPSLELGVLSAALSLGGSLKIKRGSGRLPMFFSPFGGYALLVSHANPSSAHVPDLGAVSGFLDEVEEGVDPLLFQHHRFFGGMEVRPGQFVARLVGELTLPKTGLPVGALSLGLGVRF